MPNITFELENGIIPKQMIVGEEEVEVPPFLMRKTNKGWKLANPEKEIRSLATKRRTKNSLSKPEKMPELEEFPMADRNRILNYLQQVKKGEHMKYTTRTKPINFPATIYKNSRKPKAPKKPKVPKEPKLMKAGLILEKPKSDTESNDSSSEEEQEDKYKSSNEDLFHEKREKIEGGDLFEKIKSFVKPVEDFSHKLIHGRKDYPPSAKTIINKYRDYKVIHVDLHRKALPSLYTNIMNVWTKGETNKRLSEQPKDTLFHISMWVRLSGGTTILVEKNEVIHLQVNPIKTKEEQTQTAPPPPEGLKFGEMFDKTLEKIGPELMFSYSARDNNCGNFIEYILKANGMESQRAKEFIEQDTREILRGFPILNQLINGLTDTAGRANVLLEGGDIKESKKDSDSIYNQMEHKSIQPVDWEDIKWNSFTNQFRRFKEQHPHSHIRDLEDFANMIVEHPEKFRKTTFRRASFYLHVLLKKKHL